MMSTHVEYQDEMEAKLSGWSERLGALRPSAAQEIHLRPSHAQHLHWTVLRDAAATKLAELRRAPRDRWDIVRYELASLWHEMEGALDGLAPVRA